MISPIDATRAPNVMILKLYPNKFIINSDSDNVIGMVINITVLDFNDLKKTMATRMARISPSHKLSVTL